MIPGMNLDPATLQMLLSSAPPPPQMGMPPQGMGMDPMAMMGGMPPPGMGMAQPPAPQMDPMMMMQLLGGAGAPPPMGGMPPGMPGMGMPPGMGMDPSMMGMGGPPPIPPQFGPPGAAPPPGGNQPVQPNPQPNELGEGEALNLPPNSSLEDTTKAIDSPDMTVEKARGINVSLQKLAGSVDPEVGDQLTQAASLINSAIARMSGVKSVSVLGPASGDGISPIDELQNESPFRMNSTPEEKPEESILRGNESPRTEQKKAAPKTNTVRSSKL